MNEEELLRDLPKDVSPPPHLENRIAAALREHGFLPLERSYAWKWAIAAALMMVVFGIGFFAGRWQPQPPQAYALLLRESGQPVEASQVAEYVAWAQNDFVIGGNELAANGRRLNPKGQSTSADFAVKGELGGFFIVAADSMDRAAEIARTCPHLRYGGTIEIRPVVR